MDGGISLASVFIRPFLIRLVRRLREPVPDRSKPLIFI